MSKKNIFSVKIQNQILPLIDDARAIEDEKLLNSIFTEARRLSATAAAALDWAEKNGVKFFVDHTCTVRGYYVTGTGVIGLSKDVFFNDGVENLTGTLTHEIRHAWQDRHGLLTSKNHGLLDCLRTVALIEADARAFGTRATAEAKLFLLKDKRKRRYMLPTSFNICVSSFSQDLNLAKNFQSWFQLSVRTWYCQDVTNIFSEQILKKKAPNLGFEIKNFVPEKDWKVFDNRDPNDLLQLTQDFNGAAYISPADALQKLHDLIEPTKACRFFSDAPVSPVFDELLQRDIEREIENNPPPRFLQLMQPKKP